MYSHKFSSPYSRENKGGKKKKQSIKALFVLVLVALLVEGGLLIILVGAKRPAVYTSLKTSHKHLRRQSHSLTQ